MARKLSDDYDDLAKSAQIDVNLNLSLGEFAFDGGKKALSSGDWSTASKLFADGAGYYAKAGAGQTAVSFYQSMATVLRGIGL